MTQSAVPLSFAADEAERHELEQQSTYFDRHPLLHELLRATPDVFLILNDQRQVVFANRTVLDLLGVNEGHLRGLRPGDLLECVNATKGCGTTPFCRVCGALRVIHASLRGVDANGECRITREDGSALDLRVTGRPLTVFGERFCMFSIQDISHEKRRQALERIFFHDILNTAGALYSLAAFLQDATSEEIDGLRPMMYRLAGSVVNQINAQRELSEAENDELQVHIGEVNALDCMNEVVTSFAMNPLAEARQLVIDPASLDVSFVSDKTLLQRVLHNMIKNALEAIDLGETVTIACAPAADGVTFSVHNPTVMPRPVQLQIFQRSFTTKGVGRGLGTYSMKLLTERYLRGSIRFVSTPDSGTCFTVWYPHTLLK